MKRRPAAFTLVEIMIVVAIIGLLAVIAVPGFIRSRQLSQGRALINDRQSVVEGMDEWALENGVGKGGTVNYGSVSGYLKAGRLDAKVAAYSSGLAGA